MRRYFLLTVLFLIVLAVGVVYLEPGSGRVNQRYTEIQAGMSADEVARLLEAQPDKQSAVRLLFNDKDGASEQGIASVWSFKEWGRPYYILVGFDNNGGVSWKHIVKGAFMKLGHWLFNRESQGFDRPLLSSVEVID